jgi:Cu(I)/Ag(I) efflux system membrane fusion protein
MKKNNIIIIIVTGLIAATGYFLFPLLFPGGHDHAASSAQSTEAEIEYYTCTMHPSVREIKPGKCPLCGMELIPVFRKGAMEVHQFDFTFTVPRAKQQLIGVKFDVAEVRDLVSTINAVGKVAFDERRLAVVNMRVGGWIEELYVDFTGKFVSKGQPLFSFYSPDLVSAQQEFLLAKQSLDDDSSRELAETARNRLMLWGITPEQIAELENRGEPETYVTIHSPISGFVVEKKAIRGARIDAGVEVYKIADLSHVWILADIYEYELPLVQIGQEALVTLSMRTTGALTGRVTYIQPTLNPETRTAGVRVELPNVGYRLKPEMYANVELNSQLGKRLSVPESAVLHAGPREIVFVDKGEGVFELRFVHLGARAEGYYEVTEGLAAGERVVASANFLIDAESKIQGVLQRLEGTPVQSEPHRH